MSLTQLDGVQPAASKMALLELAWHTEVTAGILAVTYEVVLAD